MNIKCLTLILIGSLLTVDMDAFKVSKNTVVTIRKHTQIKLSDMDLQNSGIVFGDTASVLIFSTDRERKIAGTDIVLASLKIAGDVACESPLLTLSENLTMRSGVMDIADNHLVIYGDLLGECEKSYVTASTGAIEKPVRHLSAWQSIHALGLKFTSLKDVRKFRIYRTHAPLLRSTLSGDYNSANRVYSFSTEMHLKNVDYEVFPHEIKPYEKQALFVEDYEGWQKVMASNENYLNVMRISLFPINKLSFPKVITPEDDVNQIFKIIGLEEYPNARLVIFGKNGEFLYDLCPYRNNFDGKNLPNGTYYYLFSAERYSVPIKKSFFEIVR